MTGVAVGDLEDRQRPATPAGVEDDVSVEQRRREAQVRDTADAVRRIVEGMPAPDTRSDDERARDDAAAAAAAQRELELATQKALRDMGAPAEVVEAAAAAEPMPADVAAAYRAMGGVA